MLIIDGRVIIPVEPPRGLLVSMALRDDHSFLMPLNAFGGITQGYTPEQRNVRLDLMRQVYWYAVRCGEPVDASHVKVSAELAGQCLEWMTSALGSDIGARQLYEEIVGKGFYRPEKEAEYANALGNLA